MEFHTLKELIKDNLYDRNNLDTLLEYLDKEHEYMKGELRILTTYNQGTDEIMKGNDDEHIIVAEYYKNEKISLLIENMKANRMQASYINDKLDYLGDNEINNELRKKDDEIHDLEENCK